MRYDVCIIGGAARSGLPLAVVLAERGWKVACLDLPGHAVESLKRGVPAFHEPGIPDALAKVLNRTLFPTTDRAAAQASRFIVIAELPAPNPPNTTDAEREPLQTLGLEALEAFVSRYLPFIRHDHHLMLRTSVYPGSTHHLVRVLREAGRYAQVSYCPDRTMPGRALDEIRTAPQIIAAFDDASLLAARTFFTGVASRIIELEPLEAELARLFVGAVRYIQFAAANQLHQIASEHGQDYYRILHAVQHDFQRMQALAPAGLTGGPALVEDTLKLAAYTSHFDLGLAAHHVNTGMPRFIVDRLRRRFDLSGKCIGILGMTYKPDIDDIRHSLAYRLRSLLRLEAAKVLCADAYHAEPGFLPEAQLIREADIIVIGAPHQRYASLNIPDDKPVLDVWNFIHAGQLII